ncbi:MAG: mismatch repair endonuclease MutL [Bacteroidota bacterium]|jgi:DNA mismatch repair protein MutL
MKSIIQLLPDHVANQIAAGEVIQRPASVVKELLENSIDAGAGKIQLLIKEAGRSVIQVIDDGSGMSPSDARMCFERHATSKISSADDLFNLHTKGFRGEAMASIAAIAHIELITKMDEDDLGTKIIMEGSEVIENESCSCATGTSIAVKNLFYNVPARRKFLKTNAIEFKHIVEEFIRVALAHPSISFSLHHNEQLVYFLESGPLKRRLVDLLGKAYDSKLVPVEENTDIVNISGYIIKPDFCKKTRGEQYFFANNRFIKNFNLNHAVVLAYEQLIPHGTYPGYFIFLEVNPNEIDINIHPTKTEVKFEDERSIFAILKSTIHQSLSKYALKPTLDFEQENSFDVAPLKKGDTIQVPDIKVNKTFNPFESEKIQEKKWESGGGSLRKKTQHNWENLFEKNDSSNNFFQKEKETITIQFESEDTPKELNLDFEEKTNIVFCQQISHKYILTNHAHGFALIHQRRAHERVLFDYFMRSFGDYKRPSQQTLFPETLDLNPQFLTVLEEILPQLKTLGFDINPFGQNTYVINGTPADIPNIQAKETIEFLLEQYLLNEKDFKAKSDFYIAKSMASKIAIKTGQVLQNQEIIQLLEELYRCENQNTSPSGKKIKILFEENDIVKLFGI